MNTVDLSQYGIKDVKKIIHNPSYDDLYKDELNPALEGYEKGYLTDLGAVDVFTGVYTGRSPKDKYLVKDEVTENTVWWTSDGYKNDLLSVFYRDGFINGVADENGDSKKLILCYAINGYPLVDSEGHEGYTGLAGNTAGPIRVIAETNQGASVKYCNKLVVTVPGSDKIDIKIDNSIFK